MMKKLLLMVSAMFVLSASVKSQTIISADTTICDTLHYYFNKYHFKTGTLLKDFQFYKSAAATNTLVSHMGSRFENFIDIDGDTMTITGLEAFASKHPKTASPVVGVKLYLCTLDVNKMPFLPPIDSVLTSVTSTVVGKIGGDLIHGPRKLGVDFAVLFRNSSTIAGDTARLLRTAGTTYTSNTPMNQRNSDGYGYIRHTGTFVTTANYTLSQGFGYGTSYEFCVAPRVCYRLKSGQIKPAAVDNGDTICTFTPLVFTNNSSKRYTHRQYNLNEFCTLWNLYAPFVASPQAPGGWSGDSAITWKFESEDSKDGRVFLGYGGRPQTGTNGPLNAITFATDSVNSDLSCFTANEFRARLRPMSIYGRMPQYVYNETFKICTHYCNGDGLSTGMENSLDRLRIYPNPMVNGLTNIRGLNGKSNFSVYNLVGQLVYNSSGESESAVINLQSQPAGAYLLRIDTGSGSRMVKIIKQD